MARSPIDPGTRFVRYRWYNPLALFCLLFVAIGVCGIANGLRLYAERAVLGGRGVITPGTVVRVDDRSDTEGAFFRPVVQFAPPGAASPVEFASRAHSANSGEWTVGQPVPVLYLPDRPERAELASAVRGGAGEWLWFVFGAGFVLVGGVSARQMIRGHTPSYD